MRFWNDKATIKRQTNVLQGNGFQKNELVTVYENIDCHLSAKSLQSTNRSGQATSIDYDFVLFCSPNVIININDVIEVNRKGKIYNLYAGMSMNYDKSCQTRLSFTPTANEV